MAEIIAYILAALAVGGAFGVIVAANPLNSALYLILCLIGVAGFYAMLGSGFLAIVQVLIYVGAVVTLFVMVVMLLNMAKVEPPEEIRTNSHWLAIVASAIICGYLVTLVWGSSRLPVPASSTAVARALFGRLALPFELTSLLLLIGVLAVVALARREKGL